MIEYRKATVCDVDELARIRSLFLMEAKDVNSEAERNTIENMNKLYFKTSIIEESFISWIALKDGKIIATSGLSFYKVPPSYKCPEGRVAYIMNMFTFPDYRNRGIGTKLFELIVSEAKSRGYKKITLNATMMGKPLYEKYGFKDVNGAMVYYLA